MIIAEEYLTTFIQQHGTTTYAWWCTYNGNLDNRYMHFSITYDQIIYFFVVSTAIAITILQAGNTKNNIRS